MRLSFSRFCIYGTLSLPCGLDGTEFLKIGYIGLYRSPSLSMVQNGEYFTDISAVCERLVHLCTLSYMLGDLNCFEARYFCEDNARRVEESEYKYTPGYKCSKVVRVWKVSRVASCDASPHVSGNYPLAVSVECKDSCPA